MHFGVGMACGGGIALGIAAIRRRGFESIGPAMTLGGIWAMVPDLHRIFSWYPSLPFAEKFQRIQPLSDIFFFHKSLDTQPAEYTLLGFGLILFFYNLVIFAPWIVRIGKSQQLRHIMRLLDPRATTRRR